jgi:hypothetical protein
MSVQVSCPGCGGPIVFKLGSSIVGICPYCRSAVARGDRRVEDLGKVAALADTESPLEVGLRGKYQGVPFDLVGRAQLAHPAGGLWDEWYAAFADGRWGWLAEAQGRFYLTFRFAAKPGSLPAFSQLQLGQSLPLGKGMIVAEKSQAQAVAAQGEIPYLLVPGKTNPFADLSGEGGTFGTIDYSEEPPLVFLGREVTLDELEIPKSARRDERFLRQVGGVQLACPQCAGPLELRAPDRSQRVACPSCGSLLDVEQGNLKFFQALEPGQVKPLIPLGTVGKLEEGEFTAIGYLVRRVKVEGVKYFWEEYLLYNPRLGFRWLVCNDDHWSYVRPLPPGDVRIRSQQAEYRGEKFKRFSQDHAKVEYVLGEFYWKVAVGEVAEMADFIRPPRMLSQEITIPSESGEINWSLGTYTPPRVIQEAFKLPKMPRPTGIAPHQPFPYSKVYVTWGILVAVWFLLGVLLMTTAPNRRVYEQTFALMPLSGTEKSQVFFSDAPFELRSRQNIEVAAWSDVDNSWVFVEGDLVDEATGVVQYFAIPIEYYHGVDGGESWSEGSRHSETYLSALPAGKYTLRLEVERQNPNRGASLQVRISQGVPRLLHWFAALAALSVVPGLVLAYHTYFETKRWENSSFGGTAE